MFDKFAILDFYDIRKFDLFPAGLCCFENSRPEQCVLMDDSSYQRWRKAKLERYPESVEQICVDIGGLVKMNDAERAAIIASCERSNMAIYRCQDDSVDRATIRTFASCFGLERPDYHLCANDDGVSELTVASEGTRPGYVHYSNRSLSWHTDGYYNDSNCRVRAVVLHCASVPVRGGENSLLDSDIAYIRLRDEDPRFITAFEHPECLTIPANRDNSGEIRPAVSGPVFSYDKSGSRIHMRFSARRKNIKWRDDDLTTAARDCLADILADPDGPIFHYRLQPGEGLVSNNILHNRTAFEEGPEHRRLLYRARFYDLVGSS
jgi:alpha-ketoglutarate-dependent taurine dioxygenase